MTVAKPDHRHHCSCPKLPPDLAARIFDAYGKYGPAFCDELHRVITGTRDPAALRPSPHTSGRARILAKITPPDAAGHQHYLGVWPRWGLPRAVHDGRTLDIVQWAWLWDDEDRVAEWADGQHLVRLCHDVHCVSPDHHRLPSDPPTVPELLIAGLYAWEQKHPKPHDPRSTNWLRAEKTDYLGERCLAGHRIKVYPGHRRKSYCAGCAPAWNAWHRDRAAEKARLDRTLLDSPRPRPNQPTYTERSPEIDLGPLPEPGQPDLALVALMQRGGRPAPSPEPAAAELTDEALAEFDTLVEQLERMHATGEL